MCTLRILSAGLSQKCRMPLEYIEGGKVLGGALPCCAAFVAPEICKKGPKMDTRRLISLGKSSKVMCRITGVTNAKVCIESIALLNKYSCEELKSSSRLYYSESLVTFAP